MPLAIRDVATGRLSVAGRDLAGATRSSSIGRSSSGAMSRPDLAEIARLELPRLNASECVEAVAAMIRAAAGTTDQTR